MSRLTAGRKPVSRGMRRLLLVSVITAGVAAIGLAVFAVYVRVATYPPEPAALEAALAHPAVTVRADRRHWVIEPVTRSEEAAALIYYPGGLVAPEAYLRSLVLLSERTGRAIYLVRAPFNAAIFDRGAAKRIIARYGLDRPIVGGHSLGGISACRFASANPEETSGLLLLGSYCDRDLSASDLHVVSLMGVDDRIINRENYRAARANLPANSVVADIAGLNHSAFGDYGLQKGDGPSATPPERVAELIAGGLR